MQNPNTQEIMATSTATFHRDSDVKELHDYPYPSDPYKLDDEHEPEPDLYASSSSSTSSSKSSSRRRRNETPARSMEESSERTEGQKDGDGPAPRGHDGDGSLVGAEVENMLREANNVRARLGADGVAGIVKERILVSKDGMSPAAAASPRGVSSPFGRGGGGGDDDSGAEERHGRGLLKDDESGDRDADEKPAALAADDDVAEDLSYRLSLGARMERQQDSRQSMTGGGKLSDNSAMASSPKYRYCFDPFAAEVDDGDHWVEEAPRIKSAPRPPTSPSHEGSHPSTYMGRGKSVQFKVEDDDRFQNRDYEPELDYEEYYSKNHSDFERSVQRHPENEMHYRGPSTQHRHSPGHRGSSALYSDQLVPYSGAARERERFGYYEGTRGGRPAFRAKLSAMDKAYIHAMTAGLLWQTLVGEHVKFPKAWWGGARTPPMGEVRNPRDPPQWMYLSRHRVRGNEALMNWVRNRTSAGRLLLHLVVTDGTTMEPIEDIAIGCFHPNARGVRRTLKPVLDDEDVREIWMAVRKRERVSPRRDAHQGGKHGGLAASLLNTALTLGHGIDEIGQPSPLGGRYTITNDNVRAVFGDKAPFETVFVHAQSLYKIIIDAVEEGRLRGQVSPYPARTILQEFLFTKKR